MLERTTELPAQVLAAIALSVFSALAGLSLTETWRQVELRGFDALSVATAPGKSSLPITIVGIDEASFAEVNKQWPWPRSLYAKLIDQLVKSGAFVIAFDILLPDASSPEEDAALAEAIRRSGNVVLASDMAYQESAYVRQWVRVDPLNIFKEAGASNGFARVELDGDQVLRRMPEGSDVLWRQVVRRANERQPGLLPDVNPIPEAMIRYVGPDHTFPYVSFYQALNADTDLPPDAFRDQIVLVGRDLRSSIDARSGAPDVFATPFTAQTRWFSPGVELHANILETAIRGDAIVPAPIGWVLALLGVVTAACAWLMRQWRPVIGALIVTAVTVAIGVLDWALFTRMNIWLPVFAAGLAAISIYLSFGGLAFIAERRRRGEIRRAFSLYVSPEVVDHVMANPDRLSLGGERREVTMLFTDLEGFTSLTERLGAEEVARVLNMHFSRATAIVKRHGGTVNRFIGDAVMAMWGAPLEDPKQSVNACLAACEMQEDMKALRGELKAQALPEIRMRVGIHTCMAVVGNLGSSDRFDYTAIGDGVNLAARLEGVNKLYATEILVSGETVARLEGSIPMRLIDRVIVKGKSEAVEIFTPCRDVEVNALSAQAIDAYRSRRWDESERLWREILDKHPGDNVSAIYIERIGRCRSLSPDAEWEAAVELEKL